MTPTNRTKWNKNKNVDMSHACGMFLVHVISNPITVAAGMSSWCTHASCWKEPIRLLPIPIGTLLIYGTMWSIFLVNNVSRAYLVVGSEMSTRPFRSCGGIEAVSALNFVGKGFFFFCCSWTLKIGTYTISVSTFM